MKITAISAYAGQKVQDPRNYGQNAAFGVQINADLEEGEDVESAVRQLQMRAQKLIDDQAYAAIESFKRTKKQQKRRQNEDRKDK